MALQRFKKFERSKELSKKLVIQPRDLAILSDVADYRFLDAEQILALHPGSLRNTQTRLALLFHLGYLDRPPSQKLFARHGTSFIYSLAEKGAQALGRETKMREVAFPYLAHAMMISAFRCTLTLALKKQPDRPEFGRWVQGYELKDLLSRRGEKPELVPDAFFSIERERTRWNFFLEADRSTMSRERFLDKLKIYWKWRNDERLLKTLGISKFFRVLTITYSEERKENLRAISKNADDSGQGTSRFLFLSEKTYSLTNPEKLFSPLWLSPKDNAAHSLLE